MAARGVQISLDGVDGPMGLTDTNAEELSSGGGVDGLFACSPQTAEGPRMEG